MYRVFVCMYIWKMELELITDIIQRLHIQLCSFHCNIAHLHIAAIIVVSTTRRVYCLALCKGKNVYSTLQLASLLQELVYAVDALCVMLIRTQLNAAAERSSKWLLPAGNSRTIFFTQ